MPSIKLTIDIYKEVRDLDYYCGVIDDGRVGLLLDEFECRDPDRVQLSVGTTEGYASIARWERK